MAGQNDDDEVGGKRFGFKTGFSLTDLWITC